MSAEFSPELRKELLDDFYAECDELLTSIRNSIVHLESALGKGDPNPAEIESLYRHLHSLKGISAIVGLGPAEELAHCMEDQVRLLMKREVAPQAAGMDNLLFASDRLEQVVVAHRSAKDLPAIADVLSRIRGSAAPKQAAPALPEEEDLSAAKPDPADAARKRGLEIWRCDFTPAPDLDRRGINLQAARERLGDLGEILSVTPTVPQKGAIVFSFMVGFRHAPSDLAGWERDGMKLVFVPGVPATQGEQTEAVSLTASHIVRVDLARLDDLMRVAGELVIIRSRLEDSVNQNAIDAIALREINLSLARSLRELREAISRVRMVPIAELFSRMPFVVRDLSRKSGKSARVALEGHQTEVDKYIVERLKEPLLHLVRNAFVHVIQTPGERKAAGKAEEATIRLGARITGEQVTVQVRDDGRGIDPAAIGRKAVALGLPVPPTLDMNTVLGILCTAGFSTQDKADLAAGRGMGMSVVADTVRELGGSLSLETTPGSGTVFTLKLPLTLSIGEALIVSLGTETYAIPSSSVEEIIQVPSRDVRTINRSEMAPYRGGLLPFVRLAAVFGGQDEARDILTLVVVTSDRGATGVVVDRVFSQREIVIRPLVDALVHVPGIAGATELGDGRPILILDANGITQGVARIPDSADPSAEVA